MGPELSQPVVGAVRPGELQRLQAFEIHDRNRIG